MKNIVLDLKFIMVLEFIEYIFFLFLELNVELKLLK